MTDMKSVDRLLPGLDTASTTGLHWSPVQPEVLDCMTRDHGRAERPPRKPGCRVGPATAQSASKQHGILPSVPLSSPELECGPWSSGVCPATRAGCRDAARREPGARAPRQSVNYYRI